jgi:hypothetical protein
MKTVVAIASFCALAGVASAQFTSFTDRAAWDAAAGTPTFTEDFSGFTADVIYRAAPVSLAGNLTLSQTGQNVAEFRNFIDTPPFQFTDNNGTTHASAFTNFPEGANPGVQVVFTFGTPVSAFGFETWTANGGEGVIADVFDGTTLLGSLTADNLNASFRGFTITGGTATSVVLRSARLSAGQGGEGFGIDNLVGVAGSAPTCRPDLNNDGELTFDDIQFFVSLYNANDPRADFNNDQEWTFDDIQLFISLYNAGC